jgi:hypothetical protein
VDGVATKALSGECRGEKQDHQAERMGGALSQTRASSLVKEFENTAPAQALGNALRLVFDLFAPAHLALRAAFGSLPSGHPAAWLCVTA